MFRNLLAILLFVYSQMANSECRDDIEPTSPTTKFAINNDGTVTDTKSGLMWQVCSLGQTWNGGVCEDRSDDFVWSSALEAANNSTWAGYDNWRLPNVKELYSIVEVACNSPAINESIFPNSPRNTLPYHSSSTVSDDDSRAWGVHLTEDGGLSILRKRFGFVRLVRNAE